MSGDSIYSRIFNGGAGNHYDPKTHNNNVDKRLLERSENFNHESRNVKKDNIHHSKKHSKKNGEITGIPLKISPIDIGMPMRSTYENNSYQDSSATWNTIDFDLYDAKPRLHVEYNDPTDSGKNYSSLGKEDNFMNNEFRTKTEIQPIKTNDFSELINQFSVFMFNHINESKNVLFSGFSIFEIFGILYRGSKNDTEIELRNFFLFPNKQFVVNNLMKINDNINRSKICLIKNMIFCKNDLNQAFVNYVQPLVLINKISGSRQDIINMNTLISNSTKGIFKNVIKEDMFNQDTSMILVNTVYFKSNWKIRFDPSKTILQNFNNRQMPMMINYEQKYMYHEDKLNQILEMLYDNTYFSMGFILPKNNKLYISDEQLHYYIENLKNTKISKLQIPKFDQYKKYNFTKMFYGAGLKTLFSRRSDLSEITPESSYVSDLIHQAYIKVDEQGTEAASVTAAVMTLNSAIETKYISFIVNRSFIYYIRYIPENVILFMGSYV